MNNYDLEMKIEDALFRIKDLYTRSDNKCYLSFSGGKDSTVVAHLIKMAQEKFGLPKIPFVFADTQVEYDVIINFIHYFNDNFYPIKTVKPRLPFSQILKQKGYPVISKQKSAELRTWHKNYNELSGAFSKLVYGKTLKGAPIKNRLANKHFHFLHSDLEYEIANICCSYLKKYPFKDFSKESNIYNYFDGIRITEGGARATAYKESCTSVKKIGKIRVVHKMPIWDWTDENMSDFIEYFNIELSDAYTKYNLKRTGCNPCPYPLDLKANIIALYNYEPNKYRAIMSWMKIVYIDHLIELPFDEEYMKTYKERMPIIKQRRYEMLLKYRPEIAHKWKPADV